MAPRRALRRKAHAPVGQPAPWQRRSSPSPPLASLASIPAVPPVQRQCDECAAPEEEQEGLKVQRRLKVGAADDRFEREADSVADTVMRMPGPAERSPSISPLPDEGDRLSLKPTADGGEAGGAFGEALGRSGEGAPLAPEARGFLDPRFGRDLGHVRIHDDPGSGALAESIGALAFTHGADIYFRSGEYDPASGEGRHLLAHEIAHTFQQGKGGGEAPAIQRAVVRYGDASVEVNYGPVLDVPAAALPDRVLASLASYIGAPATPTQEAAIRALGPTAQQWVLFGLQLLIDNVGGAPGLIRAFAADRLVARAPSSTTTPLPDPDNAFIHEVLQSSGWLQDALAAPLRAPTGRNAAAIRDLLPPRSAPTATNEPLDEPQLRRRLTAALRFMFAYLDPSQRTQVASRDFPVFQRLADLIHEEARRFFAPYADAAIGNLYSLSPRWRPSAQISQTETLAVDDRRREGYVWNRANVAGANTAMRDHIRDTNIFTGCHYNASRDETAFNSIVHDIAIDPSFRPVIDRLIRHTGWQDGDGAASQIGLEMEYDSSRLNPCEAQWEGIDTLCHEIIHALAHPSFSNSAARTQRSMTITEGFTEILGNQLFNGAIIPKARSHRRFKAALESGVPGAPCPQPKTGKVGYGEFGGDAERIRRRVTDDNFRAAYFLGRYELAGIT